MAESMTVSWSWQARGHANLAEGMLLFPSAPSVPCDASPSAKPCRADHQPDHNKPRRLPTHAYLV